MADLLAEARVKPLVKRRIRDLPDQPGIYVFLDGGGAALYVGKAKSLRKRVANYQNVEGDARLSAMTAEAEDLEFLVAASESEALQLENAWIKNRQPRFNIRLRDDKTYPYLKLTMAEEYPRIVFTRRIRDDGSEYFGPYLPGGLARRAIKLVQKLFQVRVCHIEIDGKLPRPCLYHDMKRCLGPCVDGLTSVEEYADAVQQAKLFLSGQTEPLVQSLRRRMLTASRKQKYEEAARFRDQLAEIESLSAKRRITKDHSEDIDVFGMHLAKNHAAVTQLLVRNGQLIDRRDLFFEDLGAVAPTRLLSELLPQIYDRTTFIPREIHLPVPIDEEAGLLDWLSEKRGTRVFLRLPARGAKAQRVTMAGENAKQAFRRRFRLSAAERAGALRLAEVLGLADAPRRIEGFDISTFQGSQTVASLVVWQDGRLAKKEYRSFNIRGLDQSDDFYSMRQAVERRYRRQLDEGQELPDLVLIDGGRGQLNAALQALSVVGLEEIAAVGLAKQEEEIYLPAEPEPLRLPRTDDGLKLLQQVRDEAHRFAVSRHRRRRSRAALKSSFDDLRGVGDQRRKRLVRRFGSFRGVKQATEAELVEVLGPKLGASVHEQIHRASEEQHG